MDTFVGVALLIGAGVIVARTVQAAITGRDRVPQTRPNDTRQSLRLRPTHRYPRR